jgi:hypothetical protein
MDWENTAITCLYLDKAYLDKHLAAGLKRHIEETGEDTGTSLLDFNKSTLIIDEVCEDDNEINFHINTPAGSIWSTMVVDTDLLLFFVGLAVKRLNKFKAMIEASK